jgi:hypothetical protein
VPVPERIATFDNDGTLWAEKPVPFQLLFAFQQVKQLAPQHPEWRTKEPFASLLNGDLAGVAAAGEKGLMEIVTATHTGMTLLHALKSNIWLSVSLSSCLLGQGTLVFRPNAVGERPSSSRPGYHSISAGPSKGPARAGRLVAPGRRDLATYTREVQSSQQEA